MRAENVAREIGDESSPRKPGGIAGKTAREKAKPGPVEIIYKTDQEDRCYFTHPDGVCVREGKTLTFKATGTNAIVFFPQAETIFGRKTPLFLTVRDGDKPRKTPRVREGAYRGDDDPYEYAIFCEAAGKVEREVPGSGKRLVSLGQFAEGNSTPKVIIEPPGGDE